MRRLLLAFATLAALPAQAQTPLGITGAEFRLGAVAQDRGDAFASLGAVKSSGEALDLSLGFAAVNVAITPYHGFQGDAVLENTPDGAIGRLGAHLFMTPQPAHKYGLFAMLADVDGEAVTYAALGAEGILALSPATSLEFHGGIGAATARGLDWLFAGARVAHDLGPVTLHAGLDLAEFDEPDLAALGQELTLGIETRLSPSFGAFAELTHSRLDGAGVADETLLRAGLSLTFGTLGGTSPLTRPFTTADPVAQLVRRGWL